MRGVLDPCFHTFRFRFVCRGDLTTLCILSHVRLVVLFLLYVHVVHITVVLSLCDENINDAPRESVYYKFLAPMRSLGGMSTAASFTISIIRGGSKVKKKKKEHINKNCSISG
jgi:hypothetical protein